MTQSGGFSIGQYVTAGYGERVVNLREVVGSPHDVSVGRKKNQESSLV